VPVSGLCLFIVKRPQEEVTEVAPHAGALPGTHSYASVSSPDVILTAMKKAEDSNALILRMYESGRKSEQVKIGLPAGATRASITNLMEQEDGCGATFGRYSDRVYPSL
jgi:alpha-mannosidase